MLQSRHDRLAIALITLAGVLLSSSAMQPEHGRLILQTAIEVLDRRPDSRQDLAGWVLAAAVDAQAHAEPTRPVSVIPAHAFVCVSEGLLLLNPSPAAPGFHNPLRTGPLAQGQWQLTSLPPPCLA